MPLSVRLFHEFVILLDFFCHMLYNFFTSSNLLHLFILKFLYSKVHSYKRVEHFLPGSGNEGVGVGQREG
jgi:hypothetical protein